VAAERPATPSSEPATISGREELDELKSEIEACGRQQH